MNLLSFLAILLFGLFSHFGLCLYNLKNKNHSHYLTLLMLTCLNFMILAGFFSYSAQDKITFIFWLRVMMTFLLLYFPLSFHFCMEITHIKLIRKIWLILLYGQSLPFIYINWTSYIYTRDFIHKDGVWLMKTNMSSPWFISFSIIAVFISIGSLILIHNWGKKAKIEKEKRQSKIMKYTLLVTLILATLESIITPSLTDYRTLGFGSLAIGIWIAGILYCFLHYRFLNLTPGIVSNELVNNITDAIVLLDLDNNCVFINESGKEFFNIRNKKFPVNNFFSLFSGREEIELEVKKMKKGKFQSIACRMKLIVEKKKSIIFDSRISLINDKFNDPLGIMIIAHLVRQIVELKKLYKITSRENQIIEKIISGKTNSAISKLLNISERTVKTHITSIYMKLGISNKVELINKLIEFSIIPTKKADKRLLLRFNDY